VTEAPWRLSAELLERARTAGLGDDDVLHAVALAAFFGHLNRIADAVAVPLDYQVRLSPPAVERAVPPFAPAPRPVRGTPALTLDARPTTAAALARWSEHVATERPPISEYQRAAIATRVGRLLGDASGGAEPRSDVDHRLVALAEQLTLAPWQVDDASFAPLREVGFDDAAVFEACVVASTAGVLSRIEISLIALGR
jgi:alkylhydroperoxidase family enzyme